MGEVIGNGKTVGQLSLEELRKIRKEAQDSTKISYLSLALSLVAIVVAVLI